MTNVVHEFLCILVQLKIYHWSTVSYARHKASDQCFVDLQGLIDRYMEALLGTASRKRVFGNLAPLKIDLKQACGDAYMTKRIASLIHKLDRAKLPKDLANLRDEMLTTLHTCLYLFSLQ